MAIVRYFHPSLLDKQSSNVWYVGSSSFICFDGVNKAIIIEESSIFKLLHFTHSFKQFQDSRGKFFFFLCRLQFIITKFFLYSNIPQMSVAFN